MKKLLIICMLPILSACVFFGDKKPEPQLPTVTKPVVIDSEALKQCAVIKPFNASTDDVGIKYMELVLDYGICANRQNTSIKIIKKLGNINE